LLSSFEHFYLSSCKFSLLLSRIPAGKEAKALGAYSFSTLLIISTVPNLEKKEQSFRLNDCAGNPAQTEWPVPTCRGEISFLAAGTSFSTASNYLRMIVSSSFVAQKKQNASARLYFLPL